MHQHQEGEAHGNESHALTLSLFVTVGVCVTEFVGGFISGSLALLADAVHMSADVLVQLLAVVFIWLAKRPATSEQTYGHGRYRPLGALIGSILLMVALGHIAWEAGERLFHPSTVVQTTVMLWVALVGLAANILSLTILRHSHGLLTRSILLHVMSDLASSVVVVMGALVMGSWGLYWLDPLLSSAVVIFALRAAWGIFRESVAILTDAMPPGVTPGLIKERVGTVKGVKGVHHIHARTLGEGRHSCTLHLVIADQVVSQGAEVIERAKEVLRGLGFQHITVEPECWSCIPDLNCYPAPLDWGDE